MKPSKLARKLQQLLGRSVSYSSKLELLDQTEEELQASLRKYRDLYRKVTPHLQDRLEKAFDNYLRLLDNFRERLSVTDDYEERLEQLLQGLRTLKGTQFDFREELWQSSGPSTHPGVNQLISLLAARNEEALPEHVEREWERLEAQEKLLETQPDFLKAVFQTLFKELRALLDEIVELLEDGDPWDDLEEIKGELWEWALDYSAHDVEGLYKKCCTAPTQLPMVNYALNARRLYLEGFLTREFYNHIAQLALKELSKFAAWIQSQQDRLDAHHVTEYYEVNSRLGQMLDVLGRISEVEQVRQLGQAFVPPANRLYALRLRCS